jgi:hypothetical protein
VEAIVLVFIFLIDEEQEQRQIEQRRAGTKTNRTKNNDKGGNIPVGNKYQ